MSNHQVDPDPQMGEGPFLAPISPSRENTALAVALAALMKIAAFSDVHANNYLARNQSYSAFDEPHAAETARKALRDMGVLK